MFQHYIITRFNLRRGDWITAKDGKAVLSDLWLEERFELFDNYCFSSVKNQTNQNFKWLVFFDTKTPEKYKEIIEQYRLAYSNFHPFFVDGMESFLPAITESVSQFDNKEYMISSRLDNDDCIHKDYVKTVQSYFNKQAYLAIDLIDGYRMETGRRVRLGKMKNLFNPYISLIENGDGAKTVWHKGHTYWKYEKRVLTVKNSRMWMTIIHEKNKKNTFLGYGRVRSDVIDDFGIKEPKRLELKANYYDIRHWRVRSMKNRIKVMEAYYSKRFKEVSGVYRIKGKIDKDDFA
ncbi:MAG: hypothetical protein DRI69_06910 [Bacteroidetes bacterium]|nr:MAG: hypothetical protein DRI69_06910 [Bacteroidota bacterium]